MPPKATIGVIGGTGLYDIEGLTALKEVNIDTPFGAPSDAITVGNVDGVGIAFLPRHGKGHRLSPTEIPSRANIYALKSLGVQYIIAINSVGSFKAEVKSGDLLIPDQIIDRTRSRVNTFFQDTGIVAHIAFADPFCRELSQIMYSAARDVGATVHRQGTYVVMEGPAFSTRAESLMYKNWGADVIGMTALPEAKLAREAEICYSVIACVTDYDSWMERSDGVDVQAIMKVMHQNIEAARKIISLSVKRIAANRECDCSHALKDAIVTDPARISPEQKKRLKLLIGKYIKD
jgi:5'-methylthioadenosine phosphorylase